MSSMAGNQFSPMTKMFDNRRIGSIPGEPEAAGQTVVHEKKFNVKDAKNTHAFAITTEDDVDQSKIKYVTKTQR